MIAIRDLPPKVHVSIAILDENIILVMRVFSSFVGWFQDPGSQSDVSAKVVVTILLYIIICFKR